MAWPDEVIKTKRFHDEHIKKYGKHEKLIGRPRGSSKGWSIRKTAEALDIAVGKCSQDLALAKALKLYPEIKNLTERQDAIIYLKYKANCLD